MCEPDFGHLIMKFYFSTFNELLNTTMLINMTATSACLNKQSQNIRIKYLNSDLTNRKRF